MLTSVKLQNEDKPGFNIPFDTAISVLRFDSVRSDPEKKAVWLRVLDLVLYDGELPRQRAMKQLDREVVRFKDDPGGRDLG